VNTILAAAAQSFTP